MKFWTHRRRRCVIPIRNEHFGSKTVYWFALIHKIRNMSQRSATCAATCDGSSRGPNKSNNESQTGTCCARWTNSEESFHRDMAPRDVQPLRLVHVAASVFCAMFSGHFCTFAFWKDGDRYISPIKSPFSLILLLPLQYVIDREREERFHGYRGRIC